MNLIPLPDIMIEPLVRNALSEDLGRGGDITSRILVPASTKWKASLVARQDGILAGMDFARLSFQLMNPDLAFEAFYEDGSALKKGDVIANISGEAASILTAERTALNFLSHLSGIATLTRHYVDAVKPHSAAISCTRKTTPGLRAAQKYAVCAGGGRNHRLGLDDAVMIKDNHIAIVGDINKAICRARQTVGHTIKIEVEVDTVEQLRQILDAPVDIVLLDNMSYSDLQECVALAKGKFILEASGGINLLTVNKVASTGVDVISVGALTHSAPILDIALDHYS